jgi:valyl-tRNA synthetase
VAEGGTRGWARRRVGQCAAYPVSQPERIDEAAEAHVAKLKALVDACRNLRGEMNVSPATRLPLFVVGDTAFMTGAAPVLQALAKLNEVKVFDDEAAWAAAAQAAPVAVVGEARLCLFMEVDVAAEKARLGKGSHPSGERNQQGHRQAGQRSLCGQSPCCRAGAGTQTRGRLLCHAGQGERPTGALS